jgi:hypothetical protein
MHCHRALGVGAAFEMRRQFLSELWANRNQAGLEEFSIANGDDLFG